MRSHPLLRPDGNGHAAAADPIERTITAALDHPRATLAAAAAVAFLGAWSFSRLPLDAVPDLTNVQVQINTPVLDLAPEEIEQMVTVPLESALSGLPGMTELRSLSQAGLSQATAVFTDGTDIYRARQLVTERLAAVAGALPHGASPMLSPIATGLGDIFFYAVVDRSAALDPEQRLIDLHAFHEWQVAPRLRMTPGLAEVVTVGGHDREVQIRVDPARLAAAGATFGEVAEAVEAANGSAGGGFIERSGERVIIRGAGRIASPAALLDAPIRLSPFAMPLTVGDVADAAIGPAPRVGAATWNGQEAVLGTAKLLAGENGRAVARRVAAQIKRLNEALPSGRELVPLYDRSHLVDATLRTVRNNLFEGAVLVTAILLIFLRHLRAALIVASAIPLSMLVAFTGMAGSGVSGNLMSLGAIDFGLIVDGAVIVIENCVRRITERARRAGRTLSREEIKITVREAAIEMRRAAGFGELIILMVYLPVFALGGLEGRMFAPMAATVCFALAGAFACSFTVIPVLAALLLDGRPRTDEDNTVMRLARSWYAPALRRALDHRRLVLGGALAVTVAAGLVFTRLGGEFMPELDEGDFTIQVLRPQSIGLNRALAMEKRTEGIVLGFPEVQHVFSRIGTNDPMDPMGLDITDLFVILKDRRAWPAVGGRRRTKEELGQAITEALSARIAGQNYMVTQPIKMRFDELLEGARSDVVLKVFGPDYDTINKIATTIKGVLDTVPGAEDVAFDALGGTPVIEILPDRDACRKLGVQVAALNDAIASAMGGREAGAMYLPGEPPVPVVVRMPESSRSSAAALRAIPVRVAEGGTVPLQRVAAIREVERVNTIVRELGRRRAAVLINVRGRDTEGFVNRARARIAGDVKLPDVCFLEWGGQYEHLVSARRRLLVVAPAVLLIVAGMVWMALRQMSQVGLVFAGVPLAAAGGVFALALRGLPFSVSAGVGMVALAGVAVLNGLVLAGTMQSLRARGLAARDAIADAALLRLRPILMTALVASLGFIPMALAAGHGAEVQRPLATVVIGGILTSTLLTLFVTPALALILARRGALKEARP